jgi:hypothetical protein
LFIEKIVEYLSHHTKEKEKNLLGWQERIANMIFKESLGSIFSQLSPSLHKIALEKFCNQIERTIQMNSIKEYKQIFFSLSYSSPKSTLEKFIQVCSRRILSDKILKKK